MRHGKLLVTLLLLVAALLAPGRMVVGQSYSTQTVTTQLTNTITFTMTAGSSTATSTVPHPQVIFSSPFTLPPTHGVCGIYFNQPVNATSGEILSGNMTANGKVNFYIMTDAAYKTWTRQIVAGGNCTARSIVLGQKDTIAYNFTTPISATGVYEIVVNNLSNSTVNAYLTANLITSSLAMTTILMYSTRTQSNVQTLTLISLTTAQQQQPAGVDTFTVTIAALAIVIIIAIAALRIRAKRGSKPNTQ